MAQFSHKYDIWATEFTLFDEKGEIVGQADLVGRNRATGELVLADFKNCKDEDLDKAGNPSEKGIHPFSRHMPDTKQNHYLFQLSFYRHVLNTFYWPGQFEEKMLLLNFVPLQPDGFYTYWIQQPLDMRPFWTLLPWRHDDPRHLGPILIPKFDSNHAGCQGPTKRIRKPWNVPELPPNVIWTGHAYDNKDKPPRLPESEFKHPWKKWYTAEPPRGAFEFYEQYLLNNYELLTKIPDLVGKELACWCREPHYKCQADVLVKYANLFYHGAWQVPPPPAPAMSNNIPNMVLPTIIRSVEDGF
jgi:hypothetical protein